MKLTLEEIHPNNYGETCSTYTASNGYTTVKTIVGKVRYQAPILECCLGKDRHRLSGRAKKRSKYVANIKKLKN